VVPARKASPEGTAQPGGYRRLLRWVALPVTDRRWAAPLSAVALGFGLFVGVAIGPGAAGTFATGAAQIIEIPGLVANADSGEEDEGEGDSQVTSTGSGGGEGSAGTEPAPGSLISGEFESAPQTAPEPTKQDDSTPRPEEAPEPEEQTLTGIVVHVNPAAGSYTLAEPTGTLDVLHAGKAPQPGTEVSVPARLLANGTFAEAGTRTRSGRRNRAAFSGIVTYVDPTPTAPAYTVSKRGVSVLVHVHPDPSGAAPTLPALGAFAKVGVDIEKVPPPAPPAETTPAAPSEPAPTAPAPAVEPALAPAPPACAPDPSQPPPPTIQPSAILWQRQASAPGAPFTASDFAGIVEAVCADAGKLLISADDIRESGHDLLFTVKSTIDTTQLEVGQSVAGFAAIGADGSLELTGLASDERIKGADDEAATQGDLVPTKPE
jgi:hypothetical protein